MLDGMSDSIQGSRIENLHSREVDRQSPTGLIFIFKTFLLDFAGHLATRHGPDLARRPLFVHHCFINLQMVWFLGVIQDAKRLLAAAHQRTGGDHQDDPRSCG